MQPVEPAQLAPATRMQTLIRNAVQYLLCTALPLIFTPLCVCAETLQLHSFQKIQLTDKFWSEAIVASDLNRDGHVDIVTGPYWYEGPRLGERHAYAPATHTFKGENTRGKEITAEGFAPLGPAHEKFLQIVDLNADGWPDILNIGFDRLPVWYENPGNQDACKEKQWIPHVVADQIDNQSLAFVDLFGDGRPVLLAMHGGDSGKSGGRAGYFRPDAVNPNREWAFHPISWPVDEFQWYTHGLGYGDINGDGRTDILHSDGWWEQPKVLDDNLVWNYHPYPFNLGPGQIKQHIYREPGDPLRVAILYDVSADGIPSPVTIYGGSQMHVGDLNGDGLEDVVTSIVAHGYGLAWWEQLKGEPGEVKFKRNLIINKERSENKYGIKFTQMQAVEFADVDGDGLKDIVTGKRFWSHGKCCFDPEPNEPAVIYWFRQVRNAAVGVEFVPYLIDDDSGAGTQITVTDVNADSRPDILVANRKGAFAFLQGVRNVSRREWEAAQPPILFPAPKQRRQFRDFKPETPATNTSVVVHGNGSLVQD